MYVYTVQVKESVLCQSHVQKECILPVILCGRECTVHTDCLVHERYAYRVYCARYMCKENVFCERMYSARHIVGVREPVVHEGVLRV